MMQTEISQCYECGADALRAAVHALGGAKVVGARLWGAKDPERAGRDLSDALNAGSARKLDICEIFTILSWARQAGFHSAKHYFDEATGYEPSVPREPVVERARLVRDLTEQMVAMQKDLRAALDALEIHGKLPAHLRGVK